MGLIFFKKILEKLCRVRKKYEIWRKNFEIEIVPVITRMPIIGSQYVKKLS